MSQIGGNRVDYWRRVCDGHESKLESGVDGIGIGVEVLLVRTIIIIASQVGCPTYSRARSE